MLNTILSYTRHTVIGVFIEGIPEVLDTLNTVIQHLARSILVQVAISVPLFFLHHNLFALGFVVGFVFDKEVQKVVDKVNIVFATQKTLLDKVFLFGGGGFLVALTMPTSLTIAAFYCSAKWGASFYQYSHQRYQQAFPSASNSSISSIHNPSDHHTVIDINDDEEELG